MRRVIRISVVIFLLTWTTGSPIQAESNWSSDGPTTQWSYKTLHLYDVFEADFVYREREEENHLLEKHLNRLGAEGWELVAMDGSLLIFKRPR